MITLLYLASSNLQRLALLRQIEINPIVISVDVNKTFLAKELPWQYVKRIAHKKMNKALLKINEKSYQLPDAIVTANTVVAIGRRILDKTDKVDQANYYLRLLSGRSHRVYGYMIVAYINRKVKHLADWHLVSRISITKIQFRRLHRQDIDNYLLSNQWINNAGGYSIQGLAGQWIKQISGSYTNTVGLDIQQCSQILKQI